MNFRAEAHGTRPEEGGKTEALTEIKKAIEADKSLTQLAQLIKSLEDYLLALAKCDIRSDSVFD